MVGQAVNKILDWHLLSLFQHAVSETYYFPEHSSCRKFLLTDNNSQYDQYHHCYNDSHLKEKYEHLFGFFFVCFFSNINFKTSKDCFTYFILSQF